MSNIRDTTPQFGLIELIDPRITIYSSQHDYTRKTGLQVSQYNSDYPNKYWALTEISSERIFNGLIPTLITGDKIDLINFSFPITYAKSVNIPLFNQEIINSENLHFPIVTLRLNEYLVNTPFGIVVRNRDKFANMTTSPIESKIYELLQLVAKRLDVKIE